MAVNKRVAMDLYWPSSKHIDLAFCICLTFQVSLSKVLGLTTTNTNGLASNPVTGVVAYPAG